VPLHQRLARREFSFSFGDWHDPAWPRFGPLLAINEDRVRPARLRDAPAHRPGDPDAARSGRIEHRDHFGGHAIVAPGELHVMRAGRASATAR